MSCCAPGSELALDVDRQAQAGPSSEEVALASRVLGNGLRQSDLSVPGVHCGACIQAIESTLAALPDVDYARVNLSTKRVSVRWRGDAPPPLAATLTRLGYVSHLYDEAADRKDDTLSELIRAVGVSGFAAANIMLLSVSVWSGAEGATRDLFHWVSALIAIPALVMAGGIYFRSAWSVLRHGRMNMDVPIAIGVSLAYAMSLFETINHGDHAYFDASVTLLFFLLIGRTLDHVMREKARSAVRGLAALTPRGAVVLGEDGSRDYRPLSEIEPGMRLLIAAGERIPVDARVVSGSSDLDGSLVTGESDPLTAGPGASLRGGMLNLTGPLTIEATAAAKDSFLAEMVRLMEVAEGGRAKYRRIADRASALYAPVVHLTAFLTFLGWMAVSGDWHRAITIAIAVLIITCPCALGLAVPIVQVVAARRLFERGIMVKDGSAMERLAEIDTVVFDKTGTLTAGRPLLLNAADIDAGSLALAAALAAHSRHPLSQAIAGRAPASRDVPAFDHVAEIAGLGLEARADGSTWRLGRSGWATGAATGSDAASVNTDTVLARDGKIIARFAFADTLREGGAAAISALKAQGLEVEILSGDRDAAVQDVGQALDIETQRAGMLPRDKTARLAELQAEGHKALMVGDGLNDAPALSAAHVSMAPASAADIGRNAADFVFLRDSLAAVPFAVDIARRADRLVRQNFALAIGYNIIAVPIAILGHVTPLIAAIAMSLSSIIVIANAMRLMIGGDRAAAAAVPSDRAAPASAHLAAAE
ncbi:MAG: cation-translocating P-type ATPase [Mesorhizobium sp.]|nr:cation-translocating P-type ATPase [Mesorhizobium sp.]